MNQPVAIGMDIGGTLVRVGAFNSTGQLLGQKEVSIAAIGPERGLRLIEKLIHETVDSVNASLLGIGIGCTGPLDIKRGRVNNPYTLEGWSNVPIVEHLTHAFKVRVVLENDADAAALGEYWQGAGREAKRLYAVTVGTGVGTALIVDGQIYRGVDGSHPEGGHQLIDPTGPECYCGHRGCWESLISGTAISNFARNIMSAEQRNARESSDQFTARVVAEAARAGELIAVQVMQKAAR